MKLIFNFIVNALVALKVTLNNGSVPENVFLSTNSYYDSNTFLLGR